MAQNSINYKILGLILVGIIAFQSSLEFDDPDKFDIIDILYIVGLVLCFTASFIVSKRYGKSKIFGRSYVLLGIGFVSYLIGDATYIYLETLGEVPYPSIADPFYLGLYPFLALHLIINIRYFRRKFSTFDKILLISVASIVLVGYSYIADQADGFGSIDYFYGLIFITGASITFSLALFGAKIFRFTALGPIWLLLTLGLVISTAGDIWYYNLEIADEYSTTHVVNSLWMLSYMIIIYALYKHVRAF